MATNEKKEKSLIKYIFILVTLILIVLLAGLAWAKYQTVIRGGTNAQIAEWHFDLQNCEGKSATVKGIDFPMTRTDDNKSVKEGKLAPGTSGEFKMIVDTTNTDVLTLYNININLTDCPTNLKFYIDSDMKQELEKVKISENVVNNETITTHQLSISRFLPLSIVNGKHTETLYWQWPMETGNTEQDKYKNNLEDSKWIGKEKMIMDISAIGEQVLEAPSQIAIRSINVENSNGSTSTATIHKATTGTADRINANIVLGLDNTATLTINVSMTNFSNNTYYFCDSNLKLQDESELNDSNIDYEFIGLNKTKDFILGTILFPGSTVNFDVVLKYKEGTIPRNDDILLNATLNFRFENAIDNKYIPIEYIKSNGNQYIEFDYKAKTNTKVELDIEFIENENTYEVCINRTNIIGDGKGEKEGGPVFECNFGERDYQYHEIFYWTDDRTHEEGSIIRSVVYDYITARSILKLQSGRAEFLGSTINTSTKTLNNTKNLILLGKYFYSVEKNVAFDRYDSKIYGFKIYEDNNLIKNLVPCYILGDGISGLYDLVGKEFYSSSAITEFIGGEFMN